MKLNLALLSTAFSLFRTIHGLKEDDIRDCDGHPDPHLRNFHGAAFDFQSGCDVVLAKNDKIEIHARLVQEGYYSAIDQIGVKIFGAGDSTVVIKASGSISTVNGTETLNANNLDLGMGFSIINSVVITEGNTANWSGSTISFPTVNDEKFYLTVTSGYGGEGKGGADREERHVEGRVLKGRGSSMSFKIHAHGSLFQDSNGLCGNWNDDTLSPPGFSDRDGNEMAIPFLYPNYFFAYNATIHGDEWRVVSEESSGTDSSILDVVNGTPDPSEWKKDECVAMNTGIQRRHLQQLGDEKCEVCEKISSVVGTVNCYYDVQAFNGCDNLESAVFYEQATSLFYQAPKEGDPSTDFKCLDVVQAIKYANELGSSSKSPKAKSPKNSRRLGSRELGKKHDEKVKKDDEKGKMDDEKVKKCEDEGGTCVAFCDTKSEYYDCFFDLCDVDIEYDTVNTVLAFGQYYNKCSCKIPKKVEMSWP